jgi:threonine-phosphate decarboxylase
MQQPKSLPAHGGQLRQISETFGIPAAELLDFSANINPEGPPPSVFPILRSSLDDPSILTQYPDLQYAELKQAIVRYAGTSAQHIAVANGFVPLLDAVLRTLPIRRCLLPIPAFIEYRRALTRAGIEISPYQLKPQSCFNYEPDAMLTGDHDAILLANPQNPSGVCQEREFMIDLIRRAAHRGIYVLLDEAFVDYVPEHSLTNYTDRFANLVVFRSVTKFHGMPGMRVAYAVMNPKLSQLLDDHLAPWPVTTLASVAVSTALADQPYAGRTRALNIELRTSLKRDIEGLGLVTYPSAANFILFQLPCGADPVEFWQRMIVDQHIVLRDCANYEALPAGHFRAAIRKEEENRRLVKALNSQGVAD